jgi:hypothetical protein
VSRPTKKKKKVTRPPGTTRKTPRGKTKRKSIAVADDLTSGDETEPCSEDPITPDDLWQSKLTADSRGLIRPGVLAMDATLAAAASDNPTNTPAAAAAMVSGGLGEPDPRNRKMHAFFAQWLEQNFFFLEFTRPKGTEILWEFTAGNLLEPAVMLTTTDEQHTLSQPTRRRANTAHGKEGLKHASTRREIQNAGPGKRGKNRLRPCTKATRAEEYIMILETHVTITMAGQKLLGKHADRTETPRQTLEPPN